jgi:hypothetical protein
LTILQSILTKWQFTASFFRQETALLSLSLPMALYIAVSLVTLYFAEKLKSREGAFGEKRRMALYVLMGLCTVGVWIFLASQNIESSFIYFQF